MLQSLISVAALLLSAAIVLGGNGLLSVLLPVRGDAEGFATLAIGLLTSAYYLGLVLGCLLAARAIRRVGYIRAFAALAGTLTSLALVYPLVPSETVWILIRIPVGFCLAGVQMIIDAWVHERAANRVRGQVYAVYMIVNQVSVTLGQLSMGLADPKRFTLFAIVAMAFSLSLVPVSLTITGRTARLCQLLQPGPHAPRPREGCAG